MKPTAASAPPDALPSQHPLREVAATLALVLVAQIALASFLDLAVRVVYRFQIHPRPSAAALAQRAAAFLVSDTGTALYALAGDALILAILYYRAVRPRQLLLTTLAAALRSRTLRACFYGLLASVCFQPAAQALILALQAAGARPSTTSALHHAPWQTAALFTLTMTVPVPLAEELLFRAYLFALLEPRYGTRATILSSSALFTLIHITGGTDPIDIAPLLLLGLILASLYARTRNLAAPITCHAANNLLACLVLLHG